MSKNPFPEDSPEAMNWQAGYEAQSDIECPYEKDSGDPEMDKLRTCWMRGYKGKKRAGKTKKEAEPEFKPMGSITEFRTEDLEAELIKRKRVELDKLLVKKAEIDKQVAKLQALCGE